ncbi:MAG TPA: helix-turn-helix transcriptional regulator [Oscillatoriaceae cyanobacterium]
MKMMDTLVSTSVQTILERLDELGISKTEFARQLGVSPDYVYRILKGRVPFPHVRETMERMAEICQLDPHVFAEYREMEQVLPASTRLVWQRMKEVNMTREDLFQAMGGRISRPYFNSILRGDQPFPSNRAYVQLFALALDLPPTVFREYGLAQAPRWNDEQVAELEEEFYNLLFDKMLSDYGYSKHPIKLTVLADATANLFPPKEKLEPETVAVLKRMGTLGMGLPELEKVSGVSRDQLQLLFTGKKKASSFGKELAEIRRCLRIDE